MQPRRLSPRCGGEPYVEVEALKLDSARPALLRMARSQCSNANWSRDGHLTLVDRVRTEHRPPADNTAAWVEAESTMTVIRQALAALAANQRDVVEPVAWAGLSLADAAAALKISVGRVTADVPITDPISLPTAYPEEGIYLVGECARGWMPIGGLEPTQR